MMKIALFAMNGSWVHTSLAIRCLRAPLKAAGFDVVTIERSLRDRSLHVLEELYALQADVYSFSCYIWNLEQMLSLSKDLKALLPNTKIVLGGPEVSFSTNRFDGMDWISHIVCGEGEEALPRLCRQIEQGAPAERIIDGGIARSTMTDEGILYRAGECMGGIVYYESSRGCPYRCAYCLSSATSGLRQKSVAQTLADLREFERIDASCKVIKFVDRTFNADVHRANAIWKALLDPSYTKHYHFEVCATLLNEESFAILSQFPKGKIQLEFGLQSTNEETLRAVSRHVDPQKTLQAVDRIRQMGNIHVHLDLIAGLPYESYERFGQSFDEAYGCSDLLQVGFLKLLYGTALREHQEEYGYVALSKPPYTVLQSNWISYAQMQRLMHLAETLERYRDSEHFSHTLWYLQSVVPSQFAFWSDLTAYIKENDDRALQKISQPDAFRYLLDFASGLAYVDTRTLRQMLSTDFSQHENKNPPAFLREETKAATH